MNRQMRIAVLIARISMYFGIVLGVVCWVLMLYMFYSILTNRYWGID